MTRGKRVPAPALKAQPRTDIALPPPGDATTVRVIWLRNFKELVASLGGDPLALLVSSDIDPAVLDDSNEMILYGNVQELMERTAAELNCPDFGMRLAVAQSTVKHTKILGPLDLAMRNAPTVGEAFRYCADHVHAYSGATQICFEKFPDDPRVFMLYEVMAFGLGQNRQAVEHALARTQYMIQSLSGGQVRAREVWFTHEPVASLQAYRANFNTIVRFGQRMNGLFFEEQDLNLPVPDTDPQLYEIATTFINERFPASAMSLRTRVRNIIARLLVEGQCTHAHVASSLGLHPRTLQRRLRDEGESFESIKDSVRREVALRYLQQPDVSLVRLTEILGYSETSVLSRSCHRWFAASPREVRNGLIR